MVKIFKATSLCLVILISTYGSQSSAAILRNDIDVQDYRDFAENRGKYRPGNTNTTIYKKNGEIDGVVEIPIPDFGMVSTLGYATLYSPSYIVSVRHNGGYQSVKFGGGGAKFDTEYKLIDRNEYSEADFHSPRLNKVVTETAPAESANAKTILADLGRYTWFARVGGGGHEQINETSDGLDYLAGAYQWLAGGLMKASDMTIDTMVRWTNNDTTLLSSGTRPGDSGSPVFAWDSIEKKWVLVGVHMAGTDTPSPYKTAHAQFIHDEFIKVIIAANTSPDVLDTKEGGTIHWQQDGISQDGTIWNWHGLDGQYASIAPTAATNEELDATKDIRFNGNGGVIELNNAINMGAGKLQFSSDYTLLSAEGIAATWVGGGVEVDNDRTVLWQVNGLKNDALHKIGAGTLHVNASGVNEGALNVGDGTVILDQTADEEDNKQAFSTVTIVSGRPVVVLNSADQVKSENIRFGYRGGTLDLNGNDLNFTEILHNDDGARLVNRNKEQAASVTLTGSNNFFLGSLGEKDSGELNLTYRVEDNTGTGTLAGGAWLNHLDVSRGHLTLSGQQVLHANNVYYSNDWDEKAYAIDRLNIATGTSATLGEHATLTTSAQVEDDAALVVNGYSTLSGLVNLAGEASSLIADISRRVSTAGELFSTINADISGQGSFIKTGAGTLEVNGDVSLNTTLELQQGTLALNSKISSAVNMGSYTLLGGRGQVGDVTAANDSTLYPGVLSGDAGNYATLSLNNLSMGESLGVILNSGFKKDATDKLLINGDVTGGESPVLLSINAKDVWTDSDVNQNGIADNTEGVSVIQVGGSSSKDKFQLAGGYVGRGAWAYGLYAFAPGAAAASEREVEGTGNDFWDYRLQNILLTEGGEVIVPPESETPDEKPQVPGDKPDVPDERPGKPVKPSEPSRRAVTPQLPAYISLPSVLLNAEEQWVALFRDNAALHGGPEQQSFFLYGLKGEEHFRSANDFITYGYDYKSKMTGWIMGARLFAVARDNTSGSLSAAYTSSRTTFSPQAVDGVSRSTVKARNMMLLGEYGYGDYWLNLTHSMSWSEASVATDLRGGEVGNMRAFSMLTALEAGRKIAFGTHHTLSPFVGLKHHHLHIASFSDVDGAEVSYGNTSRSALTAGAKYRFTYPLSFAEYMAMSAGAAATTYPGNQGRVVISDGRSAGEVFRTGKGGSNLNLSLAGELALTDNVSLNTLVQSQRRLEREGVNDLIATGGVTITF